MVKLLTWYTFEPASVCVLSQFNQIKNSLYRMKNMNYLMLPNSIKDVSIEGNKIIKKGSEIYLMSFFLQENNSY